MDPMSGIRFGAMIFEKKLGLVSQLLGKLPDSVTGLAILTLPPGHQIIKVRPVHVICNGPHEWDTVWRHDL